MDKITISKETFDALAECAKALELLLDRSKSLDQSATHDGLQNCEAIARARMAIENFKKG